MSNNVKKNWREREGKNFLELMDNFVVLRHAKKKFSNGKNQKYPDDYPYDPPIIPPKNPDLVLNRIFEKNINFKKIIHTPYLRTRETALIVQDFFKNKGIELELECAPELGEFLGKIEIDEKSFNPETFSLNPYYSEDLEDYKKRLFDYWDNHDHEGCFYIIHGRSVSALVYQYGVDFYPREFHGLCFTNEKIYEV